jgi:hypothetical protein
MTNWTSLNWPAAWIVAFMLTLFSALAKADVKAGIVAYDEGNFVAALREFQEAAKHDDVRALNYLGIMYTEGLGTLRDDRQAIDMFYLASILGYPEAMANLARMYAEGRGGQQDNKAAVASYRAAAKAGFEPAIIRLAEIYEQGQLGEMPNAELARKWRAELRGDKTEIRYSAQNRNETSVQNVIRVVTVTQRQGLIVIRVSANAALAGPPSNFVVATPPRIAFDFPNTENGTGRFNYNIGWGDLRTIKLVQVSDRTRMILDLRKPTQYTAKVRGKELLVTLVPKGRTSH